ncbi:hypothetical protein MAJ_10509, partial [Metarhizium majus ARSEF 297]
MKAVGVLSVATALLGLASAAPYAMRDDGIRVNGESPDGTRVTRRDKIDSVEPDGTRVAKRDGEENDSPDGNHEPLSYLLRLNLLLKYYVTPCTLERWCKAYNQPKAASLRSTDKAVTEENEE